MPIRWVRGNAGEAAIRFLLFRSARYFGTHPPGTGRFIHALLGCVIAGHRGVRTRPALRTIHWAVGSSLPLAGDYPRVRVRGEAPSLRRGWRLLGVALRQREDLDAIAGDADRMLELRRQRAVAGHGGPAVRQNLHMRLAEIDHRIDGEEHAVLQRHALAGPADMDDVRLVVEHAAEAVTAEIAHHAHALRLDKTLDGVGGVARGGGGLHRP